MNTTSRDLKNRILDISKRHGLTHIGSCLSILPILEEIYEKKKPEDLVILDGAHAHLAHLVVKEKENRIAYELGGSARFNAEELILKHGIHCDRKAWCDVSGGSLGHGIGIGVGLALSNRERIVYVIVTDGSMQEGSNWEALRIRTQLGLTNLKIYCNFNSYTAVAKIDRDELVERMKLFCPVLEVRYTDNGKGFEGLQGHYRVLK